MTVVGGLLSAHLSCQKELTSKSRERDGPCDGPLLDLAVNVARRLLPAFNTPTGMPYGTVNLRHGVPREETTITCSAGVGTFLLEFATLSRLTGDPIFEQVAVRAIDSLHKTRSTIDLIGNHINTSDGKWTAIDATIGAGVDSFFEYLVKGVNVATRSEIFGHVLCLLRFREQTHEARRLVLRRPQGQWPNNATNISVIGSLLAGTFDSDW